MKPVLHTVVFSLILLASEGHAQALPLPAASGVPSANDELAALQRTLAQHAHEERARRQWAGAAGMAVGALGIAAGAGLTASSNNDTSSVGYFVAAGGAGAVVVGGFAFTGLLRGDFESLSDFSKVESSKSGLSREAAAARIKHQWEVRAADMESTRLVAGYAALAAGAVFAGAGTYIALSPSARNSEFGKLSPVMMGGGYAMGLLGAYQTAVPSSLESGREAYEASWPRISAGVAPLPGGGAMSLSGSF